MAFTAKLGTTESRPANIILGGDAPAGGGGNIFDRSLESALTLTDAAVSNIKSVFGVSTLSITDVAVTTVPYHVEAENTLAMTVTVTSNIKMLSATSTLALTVTVSSLDVNGVSTLAMTSEALSGLVTRTISVPITITQDAVCVGGATLRSASSPLTLTSTATCPQIRNKSASSPLTMTVAALGEGPVSASASSELSLTDTALPGLYNVVAASSLNLSDVGYAGQEYEVSASNVLSVTQAAVCVNLHAYAVSALAITDFAETREKYRSGESTLAMTSTASTEIVHSALSTLTLTDLASCNNVGKVVESILELTDEARITNIRVFSETSVLEFTQEVTSNIKMLSVEDIIAVSDSLNVLRPWYATALSELTTVELVFDLDLFDFVEVESGLSQSVSYLLVGIKNASSIISFSDSASGTNVQADGIDCDATSTLSLVSTALTNKTAASNTVLALTSVASAELSNVQAESELDELGVEADFLITRNQTATSPIEVTQSVAFVLEQANTKCTYSPFVGGTSDPNAPTPPPVTYTAAGPTSGFRLQYPYQGTVTDELILRMPNLGNLDRLAMTRINRETRGGTLIVFANPIWPKVQTLLLSFSGLSNTQAQDLLTFMDNYLGQKIRLIDWEDREWVGVIVNPSDPIVQDGPGCQKTASFEFEGAKV